MCGITGYKSFTSNQKELEVFLEASVSTLRLRGPDNQSTYFDKSVGLGHTRLSIIDTSSRAHQPMSDPSGRYTLIFNGEIYNYKELSKEVNAELSTTSDTEVLMHLLIQEKENCLEKLNGFFAFAFYDSHNESLLLARDRMGIKPLHYYRSNEFFAFGSEMKSLLSFPIPRKLNHQSLYWYLRLTYLPKEMSMIEGVKKLLPGHYMIVKGQNMTINQFWSLSETSESKLNYNDAKAGVVSHLETAVQRRMISDVPLGAFLSGGTDSSAVVSMASQFNSHLKTFSIGYKDHSFFDETHYAELVANKFNTSHTTFSLTNDDLLAALPSVIDYIDEPFADSSSIPTYILSKHVSQTMKVALSGDGADELFGGYYKHYAFNKSTHSSISNSLLKMLNPVLSGLPKSRSTYVGNLVRRIYKYSSLLNYSASEKYWFLASFDNQAERLLSDSLKFDEIEETLNSIGNDNFNLRSFLDQDLKIVLPGDMLTKVDLMSMANSLEVRVPFLDKDLVNFARSLPDNYKVEGTQRKKVLQDAFEHILPKELHHRPKKGFEVPMLSWLRNELNSEVEEIVFNREFLENQNLFNINTIFKLREKLASKNPEDVHTQLWSLYVFQKWYRRFLS